MPIEWQDRALCKMLGMSPDLFFESSRGQPFKQVIHDLKRVCDRCHVRDECLDYAIDHNIRDGLWGGTTRSERIKLRRRKIMLDRSA